MPRQASSSVLPAPRTIHVFIALCDNRFQGIVPVPARLGDGDDPAGNLYWGARYGLKTFLKNSRYWKLVATLPPARIPPLSGWPAGDGSRQEGISSPVLERCLFRHSASGAYLVADAYRGREIRQAITDFLQAAAGNHAPPLRWPGGPASAELPLYGGAGLLVYAGHDGLMDFQLPEYPVHRDGRIRDVMILACHSRRFFAGPLRQAGARPLLWTTGLLAPEAYLLEGALEGWVQEESGEQIRTRAARAYHAWQKCGVAAARRLLVSGQ